MLLGIVSDTHDNTPAVTWIIDYLNNNDIPITLHAGDLINPGIVRRFVEHYRGHLHFVFGNNDGELSGITKLANSANNATCHNRSMELTIGDKRIFMNHYSKSAETVARLGTFDICVGGHDHQYRVVKYNNSLFINPGNTVTHDKWMTNDDEKTPNSFVILDLETYHTQQIIIKL